MYLRFFLNKRESISKSKSSDVWFVVAKGCTAIIALYCFSRWAKKRQDKNGLWFPCLIGASLGTIVFITF